VQSTTRTRSRLTPTLVAIISILLVMLTASGCQTPSLTWEAAQRPPVEETADAGAPAPPPQPTPTATPAKQNPRPRATGVVWTTAQPGYERPAPAQPRVPVAFTTAPAPTESQTAPSESRDAPSATRNAPTNAATTPPDHHRNTRVAEPDPDAEPATLPLFYVFGEVEHPGPYHHTGRNRVFDVIAQVKPTRRANPAKVQLVRPAQDDNDEATVFRINVDRMVRTGRMSQNLRLEAGDILYVPPTGGAKLGLALGSLFGSAADEDSPRDEE
jgi:hypothetical protein